MRCRICGREFDPRGFQVILPGLGMGFDRVECALEASATGVPLIESSPPLPIAAPRPALGAVAAAGAAPLPVARAVSERPATLVGANLALLAAGTAATIYLWMQVFSPDAALQPAPAEHAAAAFAHSTVSAEVALANGPTARPQPEVVVFGNGPGARGAADAGSDAVAVSNPARSTTRTASGAGGQSPTPSKEGGSGGPVVRPTPPPAPPPPPPEEPPPPVPTSPPADRVPGAPLPGPGLPDSGPTSPGGGSGPGS